MLHRFIAHRSSFIVLGLAALVILFYRQAAFTNLIFARGDTLLYFYPYWDYRAQIMLAGRLPLWNPYLFMGAPFVANSQAGVFYPLNWPLIFFPAPIAVKISIVIHVIIAAWGTYALARRVFELDPYPAAFAAAVFALGGYLTAQVEHVNQLQGLAWLPLALLTTYRIVQPPDHPATVPRSDSEVGTTQPPRDSAPRRQRSGSHPTTPIVHYSLFIVLVALQLTAGHTQTTFITLVACGVVALQFATRNPEGQFAREARNLLSRFGVLALGILLAFGLSAIQLLPTLELSRLSLRGGGLSLNEAVSFSLNPLLLGRALLPGYNRVIFSEFVGYIGIIPLALAVLAIQSLITDCWSQKTKLRSLISAPIFLAILLSALGLFFAIGGYNPVYLLLAKFVPGFNFFRVPARWLVLWALGSALLAGHGLQRITTLRVQPPISQRQLAILSFSPLLLVSLAFLSTRITPPGELGPIGLPSLLGIAFWLTPLILAIALIQFRVHRSAFIVLSLIELLLASHSLPLNHLTTPDAYASIRPAMTQLLAAKNDSTPSARFLSLSALEFDPGDLRELHSEWDSQLPPDAVYEAIVAAKHKEVLSPNLPLTWQVPSVDGYDGGILPLCAYAEFAKQFGDVPANTDGRLRQFLTTIPPNDLISLANTRWIITDKTGDAWVDDIFYDLGVTITVTPAEPLGIGHLPNFQATALGLVFDTNSDSGLAHITFADNSTVTLPVTIDSSRPALRLRFDKPSAVTALTITTDSLLTVRGATLIDERTDTFQSLTLGPYRLAHSGDVKIYENLNVLPRAFVVPGLSKGVQLNAPAPTFLKYEAERVVIQTSTDTPGYLILTDTNYPGWLATVDGQPTDIQTAYGLFRAVPIPAGTHTAEFRFEPQSLKLGAAISVASLFTLVAVFLFSLRKRDA
ncbi:MAG TPA: YfhO family protein [Anaerolineales bacterium]|nr:YfhO family protein [Anaerolineales bacterium]